MSDKEKFPGLFDNVDAFGIPLSGTEKVIQQQVDLINKDKFLEIRSWKDFKNWFFIDPEETQEEGTWIETLFGKNQITDIYSDMLRAVETGWTQGTDVTELGLLFNIKDRPLTNEEQKSLFEAIERQANLPISDEMLTYMNSLPDSKNETFNIMNAISGMSPSLIFETFTSSMAGMFFALGDAEGLAWGAAGAGIGAGGGALAGALVGLPFAGVGAGPGALIGAKKGALGGFFGGLGGVLEATGKVGELVRKEMNALGMEFNYENFQKFAKENPELLEEIRAKAITKGVTVGGVEALFGAMVPGSGRIGSGVIGKVFSRPLVRTGTAAFLEGTGGALGEYYSQVAIGEDVSIKELTLEATGGGPVTTKSVVEQIANPATYTINGVTYSGKNRGKGREEVWNILSNPNLTDQEVVEADIKIKNDPVLENEIQARRNAFEILARLPKDNRRYITVDGKKIKNENYGKDLISKEDRDKILEYEIRLERAKNKGAKLIEVGGKLIKVSELKKELEGIYDKYQGKTEQDFKIGDVKKAKEVQDILTKTQVDFAAGKQKKAGLGFGAFDFADQFVDGVKNKISELGVTVDEFLKVNKLKSIEDISSVDAMKFGDGTIFINKQVAVQTKTYDSVGSHELLHNIVDNKFDALTKRDEKGNIIDDKEAKKLISDFKKILKSKLSRSTYKNIVRRLKRDYGLKGEALDTSVEWFTVFSDAVVNPKNKFTEKSSIFKSLLGFFNKNVNKHTDYKNLDFGNVENMYEWIKTYSRDVRAGKERTDVEALIDVGEPTAKMAASRSKAVDAVNKMEKGAKTQAEFRSPGIFNDIYNSITQDGGAINNYVKSLGLSKEKFQETIDSLSDRLMNYDPAAKRKTETGEPVTIGEFLMANIGFAKLDAAKKLAIEKEKTKQEKRIDAAKKTKEGETTFDIEDTDVTEQQKAEEKDISPQAEAKRKAEAAKPKVEKTSKLRKTLGIETGGEIYNRVLDTARKVLIRAYDAGKTVRNIQIALKKEANTYIFKQVKNMLGVKEKYIPNIKALREDIINSMFTSDLVQMERNVPDNEKVFTRFVRKLTKVEDVEAAVEQNLLPVSDINRIKKGQSVNLYEKVMPTEKQFVSFFDKPLINPETGARSGLRGTRKDQLTTYLANSLTLDAIMQVAQEPAIAEKRQQIAELKGETLVEQDLQILSEVTNRPIGVKFSRSSQRLNTKNINAAAGHIIEEAYTIGWWKKVIDIYKKEGNFSYRLAIKEIINSNSFSIKEIYKIPEVKKYLKDQRVFEEKHGLKPKKNSYYLEQLAINNFINAAKELGVNVVLTKVAEGVNPDVTLEKDGIQFGVEIKADKARSPRIQFYLDIKNIIKGVYNIATEKEWMRKSEKGKGKEKGYKETLDKLIAETVPGLKKIQKLLQEEYNINNFVLSSPRGKEQTLISEEAYNEIKRLNYDTDVASFVIVDSDFVGLQYLTKTIPSYYINLGDAGGKLISDFDPLNLNNKIDKFGGVPVPLSIRLVGKKQKGGVRLTLVAEAQLDARSFKKEDINMFKQKDVKTKMSLSKSLVSSSRNNNLNKVVQNARTPVRYSKSTRGMSTFDFDETLIDKGKNFIIAKKGDETIKITSSEWPIQGPNLAEQGYTFDFKDFVNVRGGIEGPLLQKLKNRIDKFGPENNYILTARPAESATAIHGWLKSKGINIPLKNITGLGNSTAEAKALWMLDKFAEGYNDMYFVDDALPNVKAVKDLLSQLDVKSNVQQAKVKFSKSLNKDFNNILERVTGIESQKVFSAAQAKLRGSKFKLRGLIPPSAQDFLGLIYNFLPKGKEGDKAMNFFKKALIDPFARGINELNMARQQATDKYSKLLKSFPEVRKQLKKKLKKFKDTADHVQDYTVDQAIRVYLWNKAGFEVPGLSKRDLKALVEFVENDTKLQSFADEVGRISGKEQGYAKPGEYWLVENIKSDLFSDGAIGDVRSEFLAEWKENVNEIFSEENLNKIQAVYGDKFVEALKDILYRMETGKNRPTGSNRLTNMYMNWVNNSVGAIMFFNIRSAVLQTISSINYINWTDNNPLKAGLALANQKQFWKDFVYLFNSDFLKQRRTGNRRGVNESELMNAVIGSDNPIKAALAWLLNKGFLPTQIADSFAIASGGATFYRNRVKTYIKQGLSQQEAESKAFLDFQETTEVAQQSARPDLISQQQANPLGRLILAFQNTPMQYGRIMNKAIRDLVNRRGDAKTHISKIVYYGAVQSIIFNALQSAIWAALKDEDEEEFDKKEKRIVNGMMDGWLAAFGYGGKAFGAVKNAIMEYYKQEEKDWGADHMYTMMQLLGFSPPIGSKLRKIYSAIQTEKFNKGVSEKRGFTLDNPMWSLYGNLIEGVTNIPLGRLSQKMLNLDNAMDSHNEWWQRIALVMGWNTWDLGVKDKDIQKVKEEIKEERKIEKKKEDDIKREEKKKEIEKENLEKEKENKKKSKKDGICSAISGSGNRCKNKVESGSSYCTIHTKVEKRKDGKKKQCKKIKSNKERCKMQTNSKSGYCYYHD
tara:strand:- start:602 stop:8140 length:7539 start_codon:yes stop_codon:yes gene_type:complete